MGAGQSVFEGTIPDLITKTKAKELLRDRFDEVKFDAESVFDEELAEEVVSKARFWTIVSELEDATERPASIEVGDQSQAGKLAQKANLVASGEEDDDDDDWEEDGEEDPQNTGKVQGQLQDDQLPAPSQESRDRPTHQAVTE